MESINKFKVLTVVIICMFIFVVAAMYSNTKDVVIEKNVKPKTLSTDYKQKPTVDKGGLTVDDLQNQIEFLTKRVDEMSERNISTSSGLDCKIIGVSTSQGIYKLTPSEAIDEVKNSGAELVIKCSL